MERFIKGDVAVIPFPFSDLSTSKRRPALVLANLPGEDILLCQITSKSTDRHFVLSLNEEDFISGSLPTNSFIRASRIFTADKKLIIRKAGSISSDLMNKVTNRIITILNNP
ncbi:mRNA interferase PemK [Bacteroidia bacterium]|nr:mRNA interferase PemK [Bacteroidia bacterium]